MPQGRLAAALATTLTSLSGSATTDIDHQDPQSCPVALVGDSFPAETVPLRDSNPGWVLSTEYNIRNTCQLVSLISEDSSVCNSYDVSNSILSQYQ